MGSMAGRVGSMLSPFILQVNNTVPWFTQVYKILIHFLKPTVKPDLIQFHEKLLSVGRRSVCNDNDFCFIMRARSVIGSG